MFGFPAYGDLAQCRRKPHPWFSRIGGTAGRTINGEAFAADEDGHSHIPATIPNRRTYDPQPTAELAVIIQDGEEK
jgi:pyruvate dehydrogenase complex dehydrogenase (E1) component